MHEYILSCYKENDELTDKVLEAMDYYEQNDRDNGDRVLRESFHLWEDSMQDCPDSNALFD